MSLAIYAAPFDTDSGNETTATYSAATKRRNVNNRTQKRQEDNNNNSSFNVSKVNSVLNAIHNKVSSESSAGMGDFKPIAPPISVGVENTRINNPDDEDVDLRDLNSAHMNEQATEQYYKQFMPAQGQTQGQQQGQQSGQQQSGQTQGQQGYHPMKDNNNIMTKLNYMIHLLEEQKDERTNNVTEEVVLYSFLGIFVIFIVDSFVRVGKYVR